MRNYRSNSISTDIRDKRKKQEKEQRQLENTVVRKKEVLEDRLGQHGTSPSASSKIRETSPGVYVVKVSTAEPTGNGYFENTGRLERIRRVAAKKHAKKTTPA